MPTSTNSKSVSPSDFRSACATGLASEVKIALTRNAALAKDWKPLLDACYGGHSSVVDLLLKAGADANSRSPNSYKHRPLVRATEWKKTAKKHEGHIEVVRLLLKCGADPSIAGGLYGWRPLAHAAMCGDVGLVSALRRDQRSNAGAELHFAAMLYDDHGVSKLCSIDLANAKDEGGRTPLHYLAASGMHQVLGSNMALRIARQLIKDGANVNAAHAHPLRTEQPATPLWWAVAWHGHIVLAKCFLENGADPNSAIHAASSEGYEHALKLLIEHRADLNYMVDGQTALHQMMVFRRPRLVHLLLESGADPNVLDRAGNTALHLAVQSGVRSTVIETLLFYGADRRLRNAENCTAYDLAKERGLDELAKTLAASKRVAADRTGLRR